MLKHVKYFIAAIMLTIVAGGCGYNAMQQMEEQVFRSWSDVESNLQRRADLIPNLVATVKGFAAHEKETLQAVVEARAKATSVKLSTDDLGSAQAMQQMLDAQGGFVIRPFAADGGGGTLPGFESQSEFSGFAKPAGRHGKPYQCRSPTLQ